MNKFNLFFLFWFYLTSRRKKKKSKSKTKKKKSTSKAKRKKTLTTINQMIKTGSSFSQRSKQNSIARTSFKKNKV
jgi:hypothetical protein